MHNPPVILMADDDTDLREVISKRLAALGFDVHGVGNGEEAVKAAADLDPDLILMDIRMPGEMNGVDAALKIKENPKAKDIKIVFLSGTDDPWPAIVGDRAEVSKAFGMEDFIPKTEDFEVFLKKVKVFLTEAN